MMASVSAFSRVRQCSLRFLLIVTLVISVVFAVVSYQANSRRRLARQVNALGGTVVYAPDSLIGRLIGFTPREYRSYIVRVRLRGINDKQFKAILPLLKKSSGLRTLFLEQAELSKESISQIGRFDQLTWLSLRGARLSDDDLGFLNDLNALKTLDIAGTGISDVGVAQISSMMTELEILLLDGTNISDESLATLKQLQSLRMLGLSATSITDVGLGYLPHFQGLKDVYLSDTEVTRQGIASAERQATIKGKTEFDLHHRRFGKGRRERFKVPEIKGDK